MMNCKARLHLAAIDERYPNLTHFQLSRTYIVYGLRAHTMVEKGKHSLSPPRYLEKMVDITGKNASSLIVIPDNK
jgi:hypothetical protein